MTFTTRTLFKLTAVLALSVNACSANPARIARTNLPARECPGGVVQSVNDAVRLAGCTSVAGDLRVENSELTDLSSLASLHSVSGTLTVAHNPALTELTGLEGLSAVGGLDIRDNAELADIRALGAVRRANVVSIQRNPDLQSLRGLEGLTRLEQLELVANGLLETAGLSNLREVGELTVASNRKLISLRGLSGLRRAVSVRIQNTRLLCGRLGLLPQLSEVSGALDVSANQSLARREVEALRQHVKSIAQSTLASR